MKLIASGEMGRQTMMGLYGKRVSKDNTGGVGAAKDSCKDGVSKSYDGGDNKQVAACGGCKKLQG